MRSEKGERAYRRDDRSVPVPDVIAGIGVLSEQMQHAVLGREHEDEDRALERERRGSFLGHGVIQHDPAVQQGTLGLEPGDTGEVLSGLRK